MRRMAGLLIVLCFIYAGIQILFQFIDKGHTIDYIVTSNGENFDIKEVFTVNTEEDDNYYLEIMVNGQIFDFQIYNKLNMAKKIVTNVYHYSRDYECVLPIIEGSSVTDMICKQENTYYAYQDLKGKSSSLDLFVSSIEEYNASRFEDQKQEINSLNNISIYNLTNNHYLAMENYKGIYTINNKNLSTIINVSLFEKDVYQKNISCFAGKYYVVADYSKQTKFNEFKIVDITNNKIKTISYDYDISLDSYILGTKGEKVYLFDNDAKKEYELDIKKETIIEIGNTNIGIKILVGENFETVDAYQVYQNKMVFTPYEKSDLFPNIDNLKIGKEKSGYYYLFEQIGNRYKVYRSNIQNGLNKLYLFETDSKEMLYDKDSVYFIDGPYLKKYDNQNGIQTVLMNKELEFNHNIKIGLFSK